MKFASMRYRLFRETWQGDGSTAPECTAVEPWATDYDKED